MNLYMTRRQIAVFLAVADTLSMTAAARQLHMTQPGVSQIIKELEQQSGLPLFNRLGKRLYLSYGGEIFKEQLCRIELLYQETGHRMEAIAGLKEERLKIGASMTLGNYLLPDWIQSFLLRFPGTDLQLTVDNTQRIEEALLLNELDLGIVEGHTRAKNLISIPLFENPLLLVCSGSHPWADKELIQPEKMGCLPLVIREEGSGTRERILQSLDDRGIDYRIVHTINNIEGIKAAVAAHLGVTFLPRLALGQELASGKLAMVEVEGLGIKREFKIILHRDKKPEGIMKAWLTSLGVKAET